MKPINLNLNIKETISWSRTHCGLNNYLTIEQTKYLIIGNKATVIKGGKIAKLVDDYNVDAYKQYKTEEVFDKNHHVFDSMNPNNVAVKDYKYFKVIFANGNEIIVKDFNEFLTYIETEKE